MRQRRQYRALPTQRRPTGPPARLGCVGDARRQVTMIDDVSMMLIVMRRLVLSAIMYPIASLF